MAEANGKKLHIDADWKAQAQAEKERLAREEEVRAAVKPAGPAMPGASPATGARAPGTAAAGAVTGEEGEELPPASFAVLVQTLATQAMLFLSPQRDPRTGRPVMNVELAKHTIDLLGVLEEKTKGNLTEDEQGLLNAALYQSRMAYVRAAGV